MTYEKALAMIETEFETIKGGADCYRGIRTGLTYDGFNPFCVNIYNSENGVVLSDFGNTKEVFDEVDEGEWTALCEAHGFRFDHGKIVREFKAVTDVADFILFLDLVSTKFWDEMQDE